MVNADDETQDPSNIPDYLNIRDNKWENLSEGTRQTLTNCISDSVVAKVYLRFKNLFYGYTRVRNTIKKIEETIGVRDATGVPPFMEDLKNSIDPMSEIIWRDLNSYVEGLKNDKQDTLKRLLQTSVNANGKREIIEAILDEIENEQ